MASLIQTFTGLTSRISLANGFSCGSSDSPGRPPSLLSAVHRHLGGHSKPSVNIAIRSRCSAQTPLAGSPAGCVLFRPPLLRGLLAQTRPSLQDSAGKDRRREQQRGEGSARLSGRRDCAHLCLAHSPRLHCTDPVGTQGTPPARWSSRDSLSRTWSPTRKRTEGCPAPAMWPRPTPGSARPAAPRTLPAHGWEPRYVRPKSRQFGFKRNCHGNRKTFN